MVHVTGLTPKFDNTFIPRKLCKLPPVQVLIVVPSFVEACCNRNAIFVYVRVSMYWEIREGFPISYRAGRVGMFQMSKAVCYSAAVGYSLYLWTQ